MESLLKEEYEEVVLTNHVEEKDIPDFQVKNILEKEKGQLFYDNKRDSYLRVSGRTVVVFQVEVENNTRRAVAITTYRKGHEHMFKSDRYDELHS